MNKDGKKACKEIAAYYGYDTQSRQCIEEMAELTQAINKYWRKILAPGKSNGYTCEYMPVNNTEYDNLLEEIADVEVMIEQMKILLLGGLEVEVIIEEKLHRQLERIKEKQNGQVD